MTIRARDPRGRSTRTLETAAKRAEAAELRAKGWTLPQIAKHQRCAVSTVHERIQQAYRDVPAEGVSELRRVELHKLDVLEQAAWKVLEANHYVAILAGPHAGQVVFDPTDAEVPLVDDGPVLAAIDRVLKVSAERRKIMGVDAPSRTQVTVVTEDTVDAAIRQLEAELAERHSRGASSQAEAAP